MGFKEMLKYFRMRDGLSQRSLAKRLGLSASTISMYEVGEREPDFETEEKIADFFNVDLNTLRGKDIEASSATVPSSAASPFSPDELALIRDYSKLNVLGKEEARKRIAELTEIQKYTEDEYKKSGELSG